MEREIFEIDPATWAHMLKLNAEAIAEEALGFETRMSDWPQTERSPRWLDGRPLPQIDVAPDCRPAGSCGSIPRARRQRASRR